MVGPRGDVALPPVRAIVGPTGSGKSETSVEIARRGLVADGERWPVEVVAVDAFTVYRGMDVGTAKPPEHLRHEVPHHLIDVLEPEEEVSAAWFQSVARAAVTDVRDRGAVPLLVGGSGLYFRAVVDDLRFPPTDANVRSRLEREHEGDPEGAHRRLAELDPAAAGRIESRNLRRTIRALEVITLTGRRFSSYRGAWDEHESVYPDLVVAGAEVSASELRRRIRMRADRMMSGGLLAEAELLRGRRLSRTARSAIGYAEAFAVLDGALDPGDLAGEVSRRTWRYARRQRSWFRRDPRVRWQAPDGIATGWT